MRKNPLHPDERELIVYRNLITALYFITLVGLIGMQLYRQFILTQPSEQWNDIAALITFNVLVLLGGGLFLSGTLNPMKIKARSFVIGYAVFVLAGLLFTVFKYAILLGQDVGLAQVWDYLMIILPITALLTIGWGLLAYVGSHRVEKQLE